MPSARAWLPPSHLSRRQRRLSPRGSPPPTAARAVGRSRLPRCPRCAAEYGPIQASARPFHGDVPAPAPAQRPSGRNDARRVGSGQIDRLTLSAAHLHDREIETTQDQPASIRQKTARAAPRWISGWRHPLGMVSSGSRPAVAPEVLHLRQPRTVVLLVHEFARRRHGLTAVDNNRRRKDSADLRQTAQEAAQAP